MRHALRLALLAGVSAALFACGSGVKLGGGKEGAAAALFSATSATKASGSLLSLAGQNLDVRGDVTSSCDHGGKASLKNFGFSTSIGGGGASVGTSYTVVFDNCGTTTWDDPKTTAVEATVVVLNGSMTVSQGVVAASGTGSVSQSIKGKINYGGAFDDYLDIDIKQSVEWSKLGTSGGTVSVNLEGSLKTSTDSFTYSAEAITITGGVLIAAEKAD
ncbi:MAG: hypothetical protein ACYC8T_03150 [Myxococcaceae bacterium]